jgi:hypothetical protein
MKVLHGAWSCSFKQINKGMIKIFDTPLYKGIASFVQKVFSTMGVLQTNWIIKTIQSSSSI